MRVYVRTHFVLCVCACVYIEASGGGGVLKVGRETDIKAENLATLPFCPFCLSFPIRVESRPTVSVDRKRFADIRLHTLGVSGLNTQWRIG